MAEVDDRGAARVAGRVGIAVGPVAAAIALLDAGATVPFVARYRKERTGGLDEVQLRAIEAQHQLVVELDQRAAAIEAALRELGKDTPALLAQIAAIRASGTRAELEELYAPYKKKRKTRADVARERGLEPLARKILDQARGEPTADAAGFVDPAREVPDAHAALAGARDIAAEHVAAEHTPLIRRLTAEHGVMATGPKRGAEPALTDKFRDYLDYREPIRRVPPHRYLAAQRGEEVGALSVHVRPDPERTVQALVDRLHLRGGPYAAELRAAAEDALDRLMLPAAERTVRAACAEAAEVSAIDVFAANLEALLLSAPFGPRAVLGIDPGLRTGCKCALVASTGDLVSHRVLHLARPGGPDGGPQPGGPDRKALTAWLRDARPDAIAVGNGTGGREALAEARAAAADAGLREIPVVPVSESGASVYSASDAARAELGDVDLTVRSAVHIARRLQDPLAELVKIPPASIGVGQYQHDVDPARLERRLHQVVETAVNRVGVDANTASAELLAYVAGIGPKLARAIVAHRVAHGRFRSRRAIREVAGVGPRTFEQCAGFLRVRDGEEPLDVSAVHPERYALVGRMARDLGVTMAELVGNAGAVARIQLDGYEDPQTGRATLDDIARELARPGRDPRDWFEAPAFRDDVRSLDDLAAGMVLSGVVTNVTSFGAFVDIGVHQDGLVHVSELADRFVRSPIDVVSPGQHVQVEVLAVDAPRKRISLSMKRAAAART